MDGSVSRYVKSKAETSLALTYLAQTFSSSVSSGLGPSTHVERDLSDQSTTNPHP